MGRFCNALLILFASVLGYAIVSRMLEETRDFR